MKVEEGIYFIISKNLEYEDTGCVCVVTDDYIEYQCDQCTHPQKCWHHESMYEYYHLEYLGEL
jgi:hypothetical protein